LSQVIKDIEDAEHFLDKMSLKTMSSALGTDPEQLIVKLAEDEVCIYDSLTSFCLWRWDYVCSDVSVCDL